MKVEQNETRMECDYCGNSMLLWPTSINGVTRLISICSHDPLINHPQAIWSPIASEASSDKASDVSEPVNPTPGT